MQTTVIQQHAKFEQSELNRRCANHKAKQDRTKKIGYYRRSWPKSRSFFFFLVGLFRWLFALPLHFESPRFKFLAGAVLLPGLVRASRFGLCSVALAFDYGLTPLAALPYRAPGRPGTLSLGLMPDCVSFPRLGRAPPSVLRASRQYVSYAPGYPDSARANHQSPRRR